MCVTSSLLLFLSVLFPLSATQNNKNNNKKYIQIYRAATIVLKEDNCHLFRVDKEHFNRILRDVEANTLRLQEHGKDVLVLERVAKQRGFSSAFKYVLCLCVCLSLLLFLPLSFAFCVQLLFANFLPKTGDPPSVNAGILAPTEHCVQKKILKRKTRKCIWRVV